MHIEKNVFESIFNTMLNIPHKTKDTARSRDELNMYYNRQRLAKLSYGSYPNAPYFIENERKIKLFDWIKELKFLAIYAPNLGRCVDTNRLKIFGMKSHDCHIFMQRLLPIAFRELLPNKVWEVITELSLYLGSSQHCH